MVPFVVTFTVWALLHSVTATDWWKGKVKGWLGERPFTGLYRLLYNLFALLSILPVFYALVVYVPPRILWQIPAPWDLVAQVGRVVGLIGLGVAFLQTDVWDFVGLRQAVRYFQRQPEVSLPPKLVTGGMYALVRHPLYFFSMVVIWLNPVMTLSSFLFNLLATGYFYAGSQVEERRLATYFGDAYETYRRRVPGLIPYLKIRD